MQREVGRAPSGQALVASDEAPAGLHPSGFDPSRWRAGSYDGKPRHLPKAEYKELGKLVQAARDHIAGLTPYRLELLFKAARSVSPVNCSWQHYALAEAFVYELNALAIEAATAGETTQIGSTEGESAGPQDNAQNTSEVSGD